MSGRIEQKFASLAAAKRKALITFIMGGDPTPEASSAILAGLPGAGADIIEVGMPFSDPMADGPTIEAAGLRALAAGMTLKKVLAQVETFRKQDTTTPIILMGYYNPVYAYGVERFCQDAQKAGADGVILVDLPPEEENEFIDTANQHGIRLIRLIAPTTDDNRLAAIGQNAGGFLYYISVTGITGGKSADMESLKTRVHHLKSKTTLPVAVGFGIKTPQQAAQVAAFSDAVVVGSVLVDYIAKGNPAEALGFVSSLKKAMEP
ncbi:MAG TPA: tryptophan synthase subunit alpha [Rickettsiales bacterium]|nr:tryptophan synthase subunit alpha [Rickettsiales bacterium]